MMHFNFLSDLEKEIENPSTKYQIFEAELGFEKVKAKVPFENADAFEREVSNAAPKTRRFFESYVKKHGGSLI